MSVYSSTKLLITICQFCGLIPFHYSQKSRKWQTSPHQERFTVIIIVASCVALIASGDRLLSGLSDADTGLRRKAYRSTITLVCIQMIIVLVEMFVKRHQHTGLLNFFDDFGRLFEANRRNRISPLKTDRMPTLLFIFSIVEIVLVSTFIYIRISLPVTATRRSATSFFIIHSYAILVRRWSGAYSMTLISLLNRNIYALAKFSRYLLTIDTPYSPNDTFQQPNKFKRTKWKLLKLYRREISQADLLLVKRLYARIWYQSQVINGVHYWTWPMLFFHGLAWIVINVYSMFSTILGRLSASEAIHIGDFTTLSFALCEFLEIFVLTDICEQTVVNVNTILHAPCTLRVYD